MGPNHVLLSGRFNVSRQSLESPKRWSPLLFTSDTLQCAEAGFQVWALCMLLAVALHHTRRTVRENVIRLAASESGTSDSQQNERRDEPDDRRRSRSRSQHRANGRQESPARDLGVCQCCGRIGALMNTPCSLLVRGARCNHRHCMQCHHTASNQQGRLRSHIRFGNTICACCWPGMQATSFPEPADPPLEEGTITPKVVC